MDNFTEQIIPISQPVDLEMVYIPGGAFTMGHESASDAPPHEIDSIRADLTAANTELRASAERYAVVMAERDNARAGALLLQSAAQEAHDVGREMVAEAERLAAELAAVTAERDEARSQAAALREKLEWVEENLWSDVASEAHLTRWYFNTADRNELERFLWIASGQPRQDAGAPLLALLKLAFKVADAAQAVDDAHGGAPWDVATSEYTEAVELLRVGVSAYRGKEGEKNAN